MAHAFRLLLVLPFILLSGAVFAQGQDCDVDLDGDIDIVDIGLILAARNQPASGPDDPRDPDSDGFITVLDARQCVLRCNLPGCAEPPTNNPPIADAGEDQSVSLGTTVTLNGSGSSDLDGDPLTFAWRFLNIPAGSSAVLSDPALVMPTFVADVDGDYVIELIVNDGQVDSTPDSVVVVTAPGNTAPVADAGPDQTVQLGATVNLDGSGSTDVDGDPLTFFWSIQSAPTGSAVALSDPTAVTPSLVADLPGLYVIQLIVNDVLVDSLPDTVTITTANTQPVADAGPDQAVSLNDLVQLDGSGSFDADGDPLSFTWSLTSIPAGSTATLGNANTVNPTFVADAPGTYVVQLIVNDGTIDSDPDTVVISTSNTQPIADAGDDQSVDTGDVVQLDGSGSSDADGDPLTYFWSLVVLPAGSAATIDDPGSATPSFTADVAGTFVVQLIVSDGLLDSDPDTAIITVDANNPPVADAGPDQSVGVGDVVQLDGTGSFDPEGDPLTYAWAFVSRPPGSTATLSDPAAEAPTFVADVPANAANPYVLQLIVNDGQEDSAPDAVTVTTENIPPVADAGPDQSVGVGSIVQLDGSGSFDPEGDPLTFAWAFVSRPPGSTATLSNPAAESPTFVADVAVDAANPYVLQLVVNDGLVDSAPDAVTVTTENTPPVADAGPDQSVGVGDIVQLDGSGSFDADGDPLTYEWQFISRPPGSTATLSNPAAETPTFVADVPADAQNPYVLQLIVKDGIAESLPDMVVITTSNNPPAADAGPDQAVFVGELVMLDGSSSFDADGDPLTFLWSFVSVPAGSTAVLTGATDDVAEFVADVAGVYTVQLVVNDGTFDSAPDIVNVTATILPPTGTPLICGDLTPGSIDAAGETDLFTYTGQAGELVSITLSETSNWGSSFNDARATVLTPAGDALIVFDSEGQQNVTLPDAGTYTIRITANNGVSTGTYNLGIECILPGPSPDFVSLSCGDLTSDSIDAPADVDLFAFTGQAGDLVSLTISETSDWGSSFNDARATVFTPTGNDLITFDSEGQQNILLPENGTYIVRVNANNLLSTGSYNLGIECISPAQSPDTVPLACGDLASNAIDAPADADLFSFDGQANDLVTLTLSETTPWGTSFNDARATVFAPNGDPLIVFDSESQQRLVLPETGTYIIRVNANNLLSTGGYNLGIECVLPVPSPGTVLLACGDLASDAIDAPADVDLFTFNGQTDDLIVLTISETSDWGSSFNDARATVLTPSGNEIILFDSEGQQVLTLSEDGRYTVQVNANNLLTSGSYNFGFECLLPVPSPDVIALTAGDLSSNAIVAPADVDLFTFGGQAGDVVTLTISETSNWGSSFNDARATVTTPTGSQLILFESESQQNVTLPETGVYVIRVNANNLLSTGTYNLGLESLLPTPSADAVPIAPGDLVSDAIDAPADVDLFTFGGQAGDVVTLTISETSNWGSSFNDARAVVTNPSGGQLVLFDSESQQFVTLPETGTYTIRVSANNLLSTGSYNLGLESILPSASPDAIPIAAGDLVSDAINAPADVDLFTLNGQAGDVITLTISETSNWGSSFNDARATVTTPTGSQLILFDSESQQNVTLPETGTYTIRVNANNLLSTGSYNLGLESILPVPSPGTASIACGEVASDAIDAPADVDLFTFAGLIGQNVTFTLTETSDWGSSFNDARATIFDPIGAQIGLFDSDGLLTIALLQTGDYVIRVNANNLLSTGSYDFGVQCP